MFDDKKIIYNYRRALRSQNKKVDLFLTKLSEDALHRLEINNKKKYSILEILSKNNIFEKTLIKKKINSEVYQTSLLPKFFFNNKEFFISDTQLSNIEEEKFDYCVSFFPTFSGAELNLMLKSIYKTLKFDGKFLFLFFSSDSCLTLKKIFYEIFDNKVENMFMPSPDILLLGNITNILGYKNVVVDKSTYLITNKFPNDVWGFIRDLGASNYLQNRSKKNVTKTNYNRLCERMKLFLTKDDKIITDISVNYLIGTKRN